MAVFGLPEGFNGRAQLLFHQVRLQTVSWSEEVVCLLLLIPWVSFGATRNHFMPISPDPYIEGMKCLSCSYFESKISRPDVWSSI